MLLNKQSKALTITNKTKSNTGTSNKLKNQKNVAKKQNRNKDKKPNTNIVKKIKMINN